MRTIYRKRHSLLLENDVAVGVARSLVTPRDVRVLGMRDDKRGEWNLGEDCQRVIRSLKRERENTAEANRHHLEILHEENQKLSKMVDFLSRHAKAVGGPGSTG
ncbi:hypothetical protein L3X38_024858 [Prunus dulcis]|uniref:Uncharacterized protein n=1 Tax=Prunus dulcis TaxID=3755 RepID=A0AAD4W0J8_PRUDU|nr:hypothetical protein L3X38_024858 [Prunus dulcis]